MQKRRIVSVAFVAIVALPAAAHAAQIAVLVPQLKPPGAVELRDRFHDAVARSMTKAGEVMPAADVRARLEARPDLMACSSGPCVRQAAQLLGVERVITVDVDYVGKDYNIRIHAFNAQGGDLGAVPEEKCDICTVREAARASERAADRAVASVSAGLVKAPVAPVAPPVGVGMNEAPTPPAVPPVVVTPPAAVTTPPAGAVTPPPAATTPPAPGSDTGAGRSGLRLGAYTAFGVAGAALVAIIPFAYYASKEKPNTRGYYTGDGCDSSVAAVDVRYVCPKVYSGNTAPAVIFGVGAALAAATGGVLLYLDSKQKRPAASIIGGPTRDGFAVSGSVEF